MAEGDSILRIARRLGERLGGEAVSVRTPGQRRPDGLPASELDGHTLERAESRGKHLILHFDGGLVLHSHLGMRGSWLLYEEGERWRRPARDAWIALAGDRAEAVNFGGSKMRIVPEMQLSRDPRLARLGPDVLADDFDPRVAAARIRSAGPDLKLGDALLGQRLVAGIGNIFRSEGCFAAGIDPRTPAGAVSDDELVAVLDATRALMLEAVDTGRQPSQVYRRAGMPCPVCATKILSQAQGETARTTYWCPNCQRERPHRRAAPEQR
jgi:endonuclease-8